MNIGARLRLLAAAGLAASGVFGGHAIVYALVAGRHRHPLLLDLAHGYLPFAGFAVAVLGFLALVAGVGAGYASPRANAGLWRAGRRLAFAQCAAFAVLEVLERLSVGATLGDLTGRLGGIGLLVQVVVAILAAVLLYGLRRVGASLARPGTPRPVAVFSAVVTRHIAGPRRRHTTSRSARAPPLARGA